jgi:hypothetical protein
MNMNLKDWQLAREMFETAKTILPEARPAVWNILGLALTLPGILFLFLFGMPFHVPRHGARYLQLHERDMAPWLKRYCYSLAVSASSLLFLERYLRCGHQLWK